MILHDVITFPAACLYNSSKILISVLKQTAEPGLQLFVNVLTNGAEQPRSSSI